jgi:tRNA/rRNA methyltransferase
MAHLCATAMTPRDFGPPTATPREHLPGLAQGERKEAVGGSFLFGSERFGMQQRGRLPLPRGAEHPDRPEVRLAEPGRGGAADRLRLAPGAGRLQRAAVHGRARAADAAAVAGMLAHWEEALVASASWTRQAPKKLMPRLNQLFNRAQLSPEEIHILRGVAKAMLQKPPNCRLKTAGQQGRRTATKLPPCFPDSAPTSSASSTAIPPPVRHGKR